MNKDKCAPLVNHLSRIQGQLTALKGYITDKKDCQKVAALTLSAEKSFESLKMKLIESFIKSEFLKKDALTAREQKKLNDLLKLVK